MSMKTAGILVTGEVSEGKKCDCTGKYLVKELNSLQYVVSKVTVISNNESIIANELKTLVKNCDIIIVVGESCSTIYKAIAEIISQERLRSDELTGILNEIREPYDKDDVFLPVQAKIMYDDHAHPVVYFQRIFVLKEKHVKDSFSKILKNHLAEYRKPRSFRRIIRVAQNGNAITELNEINKLSNSAVGVELTKDDQFFIFKISSSQLSQIVEFERKIRNVFEPYRLQFTEELDVWEHTYSSEEKHVKNAIENIEQCLNRYGVDNVFLSFNGGKDCTVLLHLVLAVIRNKFPHYKQPIFCLYVQSDKPFPEQDEFISQCQSYYNLQVVNIRSGIKDALQQTLNKYPKYKACFMGTRRTDPFSSDLKVFQMTDSNWPQIMRVSPLLDWYYSDIWDYLLYYKVPYCSLYDMGYTSLGNTVNTTRNPSLIYYDQFEGREIYLPAYKLLKQTKERHGRNSS